MITVLIIAPGARKCGVVIDCHYNLGTKVEMQRPVATLNLQLSLSSYIFFQLV